MARNILAAIGGYVAMVLVAIAGIGVAWTILGGAGAFDGEGPTPSTAWMASNLVGGLVAAMAGGWLARRMGTSSSAVTMLIGIVLVLGVVSAFLSAGVERPLLDKPVAELTFAEAGAYAVQPGWYNVVIPIVGAVGAWLGGRRPGSA